MISLNGSECRASTDKVQKPGELSKGHSAHISERVRNSDAEFFDVDVKNFQCKCAGSVNVATEPVFLDEISSVDGSSKRDDGDLDNCGILSNNCLSCLSSIDHRSLCSSPPNTRKKAPTKHSFKWSGNANLCEFKFLKQNSYQRSLLL